MILLNNHLIVNHNKILILDYLPYWHRETLKRPFGAQGGPEGQKHSFSGFFSSSANTSSGGVNL